MAQPAGDSPGDTPEPGRIPGSGTGPGASPGPARGGGGRRWLPALAASLWLVLGAAAGYFYGRQAPPAGGPGVDAGLARQQAARLGQVDAERRFLRAQLDIADSELEIERSARAELEQQLRGAQSELGRMRDQLAFYEQLLPPGPQGSLDIRALEVERQGPGLRYRVLLMRNARNEAAFDGRLQFVATGVQRGRTATLELSPLQVRDDGSPVSAAGAAGELLSLHFDQYQRSQGVLAVPSGFVPESVTVRVLEGSTVRAARTVRLEDL